MDFNEIVLTPKERYILKKLVENNELSVTDRNREALDRFLDLDFAYSTFVAYTDYHNPENDTVRIDNRGRDYYHFLQDQLAEKRRDNIKYGITTGISVLALILSTIAIAAELGLINIRLT